MTIKCGYVAIIGRPNVGKSTLLNALVGEKVSITTSKPQTTQQAILGIKTHCNTQAVFIDTPGLHDVSKKHSKNRQMNRAAKTAIPDANVILFVIDTRGFLEQDEGILASLQSVTLPIVLVINKMDRLSNKAALLPLIAQVQTRRPFAAIIPISAIKPKTLIGLEKMIHELLPVASFLFPSDQKTDKSLEFQMTELVREQIMELTMQELPYSVRLNIMSWKRGSEKEIDHIHVRITVQRTSQKVILIGTQGEKLKQIGIRARLAIQQLLNKKVFLKLWIQVEKT